MTDQELPTAYYMEYTPTLGDRMRRALGYRKRLPEDFADTDPPHWAKTVVDIRFNWRDRLRLLLTGAAEVEIEYRTSGEMGDIVSHSAVSLIGPGDYRLREPAAR